MKAIQCLQASTQRGYILVLNLAVLAIMLLGASYVGQRVTDAVRLAKAEEQSVNANYELESARSKLLLMLAVVPRYVHGLGVAPNSMALDGSRYLLSDSVVVSLQDVRGLVSLNGTNLNGFGRDRIERLLGTWGVSDARASELTDALLDYRDTDDLRRLNGAERNEYRQVSVEPALRNGDLLGVSELQRVYGWKSVPELWSEDAIVDHVSVQTGSSFNPNTANWRALVAMAGVEPETAKGLVTHRRIATIFEDQSSLVFGAGVGDPFGNKSFVMPFPSATLIATLRSTGLGWGYRMVITHTPGENTGPWRIAAVWRVPMPRPLKSVKDVHAVPDIGLMLPEVASVR